MQKTTLRICEAMNVKVEISYTSLDDEGVSSLGLKIFPV